jgi:hypothetical protein
MNYGLGKKLAAQNDLYLIYFSCRYHNGNINVAVQTDHGLFVPVIRVGGCIVTKN